MLTVKKRDGSQEPFEPKKVESSLFATCDEAGCPLNASDGSSIIKELLEMLKEKTSVSSHELYVMVAGILYTRGLQAAVQEYTGSPKNAWKTGQ